MTEPKAAAPDGFDEAELIERVLDGDSSAFRPLVERYEPAVHGLCLRLLRGREAEAEDLAQETFVRAYRHLADLRDRRRFAPWLFRIARSLRRDQVRKALAEKRALERRRDLLRWESAGAEEHEDVDFVLGSLPELERRALELKYFDGLSYREIADRLDMSFARVDHLIRQARQRLSRRWKVRRLQGERSV